MTSENKRHMDNKTRLQQQQMDIQRQLQQQLNDIQREMHLQDEAIVASTVSAQTHVLEAFDASMDVISPFVEKYPFLQEYQQLHFAFVTAIYQGKDGVKVGPRAHQSHPHTYKHTHHICEQLLNHVYEYDAITYMMC